MNDNKVLQPDFRPNKPTSALEDYINFLFEAWCEETGHDEYLKAIRESEDK
jgi:hypothetical protein